MLYGIAYRMLGSFSDAEDAVQDAWFRWRDVDIKKVSSPRAYLASTVSRLCIDQHRRRKTERLLYTGPWLPEPIDEETVDLISEPEANLEVAESVSMAFLLLLQNLPPLERAVFILKECFDLGHDEISAMLDIRTAYSRQLLRRARTKLEKANSEPSEESDVKTIVESFYKAAQTGNLTQLQELMTDDIVVYSDGGGRVSAAIIPLEGKERVTTVLLHLMKKQDEPIEASWQSINGATTLVFKTSNGIHSTHSVDIKDGKVHRIYTMRNPEKLGYIQ